MAITIEDIEEVHGHSQVLFDKSKDLLRFIERVVKALSEERLVDLTTEQKQFLLQKYNEYKTAAQTAASELM